MARINPVLGFVYHRKNKTGGEFSGLVYVETKTKYKLVVRQGGVMWRCTVYISWKESEVRSGLIRRKQRGQEPELCGNIKSKLG